MSDLEARIAEVLGGHDFDPSRLVSSIVWCSCNEWAQDLPQGRERYAAHRQHVSEELANALIPLIREREAKTLREAAHIVASEEAQQWRDDRGEGVYGVRIPGAQIVAQRMQVVGKIITTRADNLEKT